VIAWSPTTDLIARTAPLWLFKMARVVVGITGERFGVLGLLFVEGCSGVNQEMSGQTMAKVPTFSHFLILGMVVAGYNGQCKPRSPLEHDS